MSKKRKCLAWILLASLLIESAFPWAMQAQAGDTPATWVHVSQAEKDQNTMTYEAGTGVFQFPNVDTGWSARMFNTELDLSGKDWAVEFDANLQGGELFVAPVYEDATHFAGVGLDFGGGILDGIVYDESCKDDFSYATGYTDTYVPVSGMSLTARTKIEFRNGTGGTLAGGTATVYQKAAGASAYTKLGVYTFGNNIADTAAPNRLMIQLRLGAGSISNVSVSEIKAANWVHVSQAEKDLNTMTYNGSTGVFEFPTVDTGWSARMVNTDLDLSGKNWAVEFDANLLGGELFVAPVYEDATHFAGVGMDFGGGILDGIVFDGTCKDDFSYATGYTDTYVPVTGMSLTARTKIEFRNGTGGTLAGGTATVYQKAVGASEYTLLGTYTFGDNIADTAAPNRLMIQLRLGGGSISNVKVTELYKTTWTHVSQAEKDLNTMTYTPDTETFQFPNVDTGWSARMFNTELDLSGKNWAVEFDANLLGGELFVSPVYEDATHFAGLGLDFGGRILDGIVFDGSCKDDFSYAGGYTDTYVPASSLSATGRTKIEFRNGEGGTLAGGTATVYQMANGATSYTMVQTYTFGDNIADTAAPNRLLIQLRLGAGTISNVTVTELVEGGQGNPSNANWEHISQAEKDFNTMTYEPSTGIFQFPNVDEAWTARMINTDLDLTGKDWTVEFDANLIGGELLVSPVFEDATHFAGVGLDFGGRILDAVVFDGTCKDDFSYVTGYTDIYAQAPGLSLTGRTKIEFRRGDGGTMAGGTATVYQKLNGAAEYTKLGTYIFANNIADTEAPNRLMIQLRLGAGSISNVTVTELTTGEPEPGEPGEKTWTHISDVEAAAGTMSYNEETGVMNFPVADGGWSARMLHTKWDLSGKNWALEFDVDLLGGELLVAPVYEDAVHFAGVGIDFGASILDGVVVDGDIIDEMSYITGYTDNYVSVKTPAKKGRIKMEIRNSEAGTMTGGSIVVYQKAEGDTEFVKLGAYVFDDKVVDTALPNQLMIHLRLGAGTISDIALTEISDGAYVPEKQPTWVHMNAAEEELGYARYDQASDTMTFKDCFGWAGRMLNTEIADISGQNFAVEFDASLNPEGIIGVTPFYEKFDTFYAIGYDVKAYRLDGVGIMGSNEGKLNVIDEFAYVDDTIYPAFGIRQAPTDFVKNVRIRAEFFLGPNGTMAGGTATYCYKENGSDTWQILGRFLMPDTIVDDPDVPNKVMIYGHVINGSIKNIDVIQNLKTSIVQEGTTTSKKWGYVSKTEEIGGTAYYSDAEDKMTILLDAGWNARMLNLEVKDVTGKAFAMEFDTDFGVGGAIGIIPFFEDADNWYGVYLDRGAGRLDGVGYKNGKIIDEFCYVDDTLQDSFMTLDRPGTGKFRMRFEYFPNADGGAAGATCKIFFRSMVGDQNRLWRLAGEFKIPADVEDHKGVPNRIGIHGRLLTGTLSGITYTEIDPNTQTEYYQTVEAMESGYPDASYQETAGMLKITEFGSMPWYSYVLIGGGALLLLAVVLGVILNAKRNKKK